jgi:hypothetical protein
MQRAISGRTHRSTLLGAACLSILVVLAGTVPTDAHEPVAQRQLNPSHFNGDGGGGQDSSGESNEAQVAGDAFDGVNTAYPLRSIATAEALYYAWFLCNSPADNPIFPANACGPPVADDSSPTLSNPPGGAGQVAAFSGAFDIPVDGGRTIKGVACIEFQGRLGPVHCKIAAVDPVHLDDSGQTGDHPPTTSGEFTAPAHGATVLNAGFTAVAYTSEGDIGRLYFCLDVGTNPANELNASPATGCDPGSAPDPIPDDSAECSGVPAGADCWSVTIDPPDDAEFALGIVEQDDGSTPENESSGAGDCEDDTFQVDGFDLGDDCQLDRIYLTSLATIPGGTTESTVTCPGFGKDKRNQVVGFKSNDELVGTNKADVICGLGGKDVIRGLGGKDLLLGGPKADVLKGGPKRDVLKGGPGRDRCQGGPGRDREVSC